MIDDAELVRCPRCGREDVLDGYDVLGADKDCLFCIGCNAEFHAATGKLHGWAAREAREASGAKGSRP